MKPMWKVMFVLICASLFLWGCGGGGGDDEGGGGATGKLVVKNDHARAITGINTRQTGTLEWENTINIGGAGNILESWMSVTLDIPVGQKDFKYNYFPVTGEPDVEEIVPNAFTISEDTETTVYINPAGTASVSTRALNPLGAAGIGSLRFEATPVPSEVLYGGSTHSYDIIKIRTRPSGTDVWGPNLLPQTSAYPFPFDKTGVSAGSTDIETTWFTTIKEPPGGLRPAPVVYGVGSGRGSVENAVVSTIEVKPGNIAVLEYDGTKFSNPRLTGYTPQPPSGNVGGGGGGGSCDPSVCPDGTVQYWVVQSKNYAGNTQAPLFCAAAATYRCFLNNGLYKEAGCATTVTQSELTSGMNKELANASLLGTTCW